MEGSPDFCENKEQGMSSYKFNGKLKINGVEGKTPFLIGVAGGTASGKVSDRVREFNIHYEE